MKTSNTGLSALIITYNEEDHIGRCIESLKDIADEIVVVDSYSTDNTKAICKRYNIRFVENKFIDYIQQKNFGASQINNPYILSIDADEALSEELKISILKAKKSFDFEAYSFNRLNRFGVRWIKHGSWYPDRKIRLWRNAIGKWGGPTPHEVLQLKKGIKVKKLNGDLLHYHVKDYNELNKKSEYYSGLWASRAFENGVKPNKLLQYLKPVSAFFIEFVLKGGFLAGKYGYLIAKNASKTRFRKYKKLNKLYTESHNS